ncbi:50S ribosomal protein L21 [Alphaproteobacteria bacterium]|nr:50S ribosomal protein L21 [Alphaproteobacteria bacterium]
MLAVFKTGGKQYSVKAGQILKVEKLHGNTGDSISFNDILAISDASDHTIGNPLVKGATIKAKILEQIRDKKIIVFKKRQRQNYRHTQGHRQYLTVLHIESIILGDKKSLAPIKKVLEKNEIKNESKIDETPPIKKTAVKKKTTVKKTAVKKKTTVKKTAVKKKTVTKKKIEE